MAEGSTEEGESSDTDGDNIEITAADIPETYEYASVLLGDINEVLQQFEELYWSVNEAGKLSLNGFIVYEDVSDKGEPISVQIMITFPPSYPFMVPTIYLPKFTSSPPNNIVDQNGRLSLELETPWISSPVLLDLVEGAITLIGDNISSSTTSSVSQDNCNQLEDADSTLRMNGYGIQKEYVKKSYASDGVLYESWYTAIKSPEREVSVERMNLLRPSDIEREIVQHSGVSPELVGDTRHIILDIYDNYLSSLRRDIDMLSRKNYHLKDENTRLRQEVVEVETDIESCWLELQSVEKHRNVSDTRDMGNFTFGQLHYDVSNNEKYDVKSKLKALDDSISVVLHAFEMRKLKITDFLYFTRYVAKLKFYEILKLKLKSKKVTY